MPRVQLGLDYYPVEPIQDFRSKQPQIVILLIRPITVAEHLPKGLMFFYL
jgi:hypothetical protein